MNTLYQAINIASSTQILMSVKQIIWSCHRSLLSHNNQEEIDLLPWEVMIKLTFVKCY